MHFVETNGTRIPALGFGTYRLGDDEAERMVSEALEIGYRHIDTAQMYGNEAGVGRAIRSSGVDRDEIFLTTKVWPNDFEREKLLSSMQDSLDKLGLEYVDLVLLHWPSTSVPLSETISALNASRERGDTRHIGVSNFEPDLLLEAAGMSDAPIINNQVEYHPFKSQKPVLEEARSQGISLTAYRPLAKGSVYGKTRRCARSPGRTARMRARSRCAGWCSNRASWQYQRPRTPSAPAPTSTSSTSSFRMKRCPP